MTLFPHTSQTRRYAYIRVNKTEAYLNSLSAEDQRLLSKYRSHLDNVRGCIDCNQSVICEILRDRVLYPTSDGDTDIELDEAPEHVRHGDMDQVSVVRKSIAYVLAYISISTFLPPMHSGTKIDSNHPIRQGFKVILLKVFRLCIHTYILQG